MASKKSTNIVEYIINWFSPNKRKDPCQIKNHTTKNKTKQNNGNTNFMYDDYDLTNKLKKIKNDSYDITDFNMVNESRIRYNLCPLPHESSNTELVNDTFDNSENECTVKCIDGYYNKTLYNGKFIKTPLAIGIIIYDTKSNTYSFYFKNNNIVENKLKKKYTKEELQDLIFKEKYIEIIDKTQSNITQNEIIDLESHLQENTNMMNDYKYHKNDENDDAYNLKCYCNECTTHKKITKDAHDLLLKDEYNGMRYVDDANYNKWLYKDKNDIFILKIAYYLCNLLLLFVLCYAIVNKNMFLFLTPIIGGVLIQMFNSYLPYSIHLFYTF